MNNSQILGVVLIVLGALLLLDWIHIPYLTTILGIVLLVVGILILMKSMKGAPWLGVTCVVLGLLLVLPYFDPVQRLIGNLLSVLVTIVAILLIILGILKVVEKA